MLSNHAIRLLSFVFFLFAHTLQVNSLYYYVPPTEGVQGDETTLNVSIALHIDCVDCVEA